MYTGIAEATGTVTDVSTAGEGLRLALEAEDVLDGLEVGDSVSVSGVCLTAEEVRDGEIECFAAEETIERSWFSDVSEGDLVNLERPLRPNDRMGGHIVEGHVETSVAIREFEELEEGWNLSLEKPEGLERYVVEKGYATVEGMSLTVTDASDETFSVTIIPETYSISNLSEKEVGDEVNLETDVVARYVESIAESA